MAVLIQTVAVTKRRPVKFPKGFFAKCKALACLKKQVDKGFFGLAVILL